MKKLLTILFVFVYGVLLAQKDPDYRSVGILAVDTTQTGTGNVNVIPLAGRSGYGLLRYNKLSAKLVKLQVYDGSNWIYVGQGSTGGGGSFTVLGTANKIDVSGTSTKTFTISPTYVGQSSITTVGALGSGSIGSGFTLNIGAATISGRLQYANFQMGSALSVLGNATNGTADYTSITAGSDFQVLRRSGTAIGFGAVNLASSNAVTGVLPAANLPVASTSNPGIVTAIDYTSFTNKANKLLPPAIKTGSYVFAAGDDDLHVLMNVATSNTLTLNSNLYPVGTFLYITQLGAGTTTLTPGSGVTFVNSIGVYTGSQYAAITLYQYSLNNWVAYNGGPGGGGSSTWGGITGTLSSQTDLQAALDAKLNKLGSPNIQTGNYTLVLGDESKNNILRSASSGTFTIPANVFPVGTYINFTNDSTGLMNIANGVGVVVYNASGNYSVQQYAPASAYQVRLNQWIIYNSQPPRTNVTVSSTYTIQSTDLLVHVSSGTFTMTLQTATAYPEYQVVVIDNRGSGTVTLATTPGQTINGTTPGTITTGNTAKIYRVGTAFFTQN